MKTILQIAAAFSVGATAVAAHGNGPSTAESEGELHPAYLANLSPLPTSENDIQWSWKNGLNFQTADGNVKGKFGGRIQWDVSNQSVDMGLPPTDGSEFRRSRLFVDIAFYEWFLKAQYDFAGNTGAADNRPGFNDVYIGRKNALGTVDFKAGHFKEPFSLEELTSSKYITFMERSLPTSFAPARNNGIMIYDEWGGARKQPLRGTWGLGLFQQSTGNSGQSVGEGNWAVTARGTWLPYYQNGNLIHLGLGYSIRDDDAARFRSRPEMHLSDRFIDTAVLASDDVDLGNVELGGAFGPVHGAVEYYMADASAGPGGMGGDFDGYYAQVGWFLTGETRPYSTSGGTWTRVVPRNSYGKGKSGLGAMETAVRYSTLDLNDGLVTGGEEENITLAFNWYLSPNLRFGVNWVMGTVEPAPGAADLDFDGLMCRFQVDW